MTTDAPGGRDYVADVRARMLEAMARWEQEGRLLDAAGLWTEVRSALEEDPELLHGFAVAELDQALREREQRLVGVDESCARGYTAGFRESFREGFARGVAQRLIDAREGDRSDGV